MQFAGYRKAGSSRWDKNEVVHVDLELDLIDMLIYDPFLGENLIKCLFRYYPLLPEYVKSIFIEMYTETHAMLRPDQTEAQIDGVSERLEKELQLKINLKLTHFPYSVRRIDPKALLNNNLLLNHGQLVQIKFARVLSVQQPSCYILRRLKVRACSCHLSPPEINEVNNNPLKIFKNFVSYAAPSGKDSLYYDVVGAGGPTDGKGGETYCNYCHEKYRVKIEKFAPCQMIEILDFGGDLQKKRHVFSLSSSISQCWLVEPFINQVEAGDMICLTAFYYMTPQQKMVDSRCVSPLAGSFVAFDIVKVNPFNQMI
jgi:hypothetical protein